MFDSIASEPSSVFAETTSPIVFLIFWIISPKPRRRCFWIILSKPRRRFIYLFSMTILAMETIQENFHYS